MNPLPPPLVDEQPTLLNIADYSGSDRFAGDRPIRALHVINGQHYSGAERVQDLLALRLPNEGCEIGFATLVDGKFRATRQSQATPCTELKMRSRFDLFAGKRLADLATQGAYDFLHAHTPRALLVAAAAKLWCRLPIVYHVHSPVGRDSTRWLQNQLNKSVERICLRSVDEVVVVSPTLVDYMADMGVATNRLTCVPNGVPVSERSTVRFRSGDEPLVLGMVALFRPRKGTEVLLEAIAKCASQGTRVKLRLIGGCETQEYEQQLKDQARQLGIERSVDWIGFTDDVPAELNRIDAMVLPSLFGEGLPMVVLEAMAAGLPVVASSVEGTTMAVEDGVTGVLVKPDSASELAAAIERLAAGEVDLQSLGRSARQRHADLFSDRSMARGVAEIYRKRLARSAR